MKFHSFFSQIAAGFMIVLLALTALPVDTAYATAATYNIQQNTGTTVATGITTNDATCGGAVATGPVTTLMSAATHACASESIQVTTAGTILDVWFNTAYTAETIVTGTSLNIHLREAQGGGGAQTWTAGVMLM
ncbi:MAG: hypothetical protein HY867_04835 [Chloroflexi bacterium]|nr:hypothetical protein [Chloroflexota bacterium]